MSRRSLMPSSFEQGLEPFDWLRNRVDELFDNVGNNPLAMGIGSRGYYALLPDIDVSETENEFIVTTDLPGLEEKDINVELSNNILRISGEKKIDREEKGKNFHCVERTCGSFNRSVQLPKSINEDNVQAKFKNGVLTISIQKSNDSKNKTKRIEVKSS